MLARLSRLVAVAAFSFGALAVGAPAHADGPATTVNYDFLSGYASFWVPGRVPGQPGNSHSGYVVFNNSDHDVMLVDWRCPAGVVPPDAYYADGDPTGGCTPLRSRSGSTPTRYPVERGPLAATFTGPMVIGQLYPAADSSATVPLNLTFQPIGPVTRTVDDEPDYGYRDVTLTAPMRLRGRLAWVRFDDPRTRVSINYYDRSLEYLY